MARPGNRHNPQNKLRIIGGLWRGRRLQFPPVEGLRPTPDRVRETLFNWLAPNIIDARCLDLFAGSGALGLEALSRGAGSCDFVDNSHTAVQHIEQHLRLLQPGKPAACHQTTALEYLDRAKRPYDIVFLDPPFKQDLIGPVCTMLFTDKLINEGGMIYVETSADEPPPSLPEEWALLRDKVAGEVAYRLFECRQNTANSG